MALTTALERDMISVRQAIARLSSIKLGPTSTPTFGSLVLTSSLGVASGGTGASSLTDHSLLVGSGTDAVTALGVATNGQLPIGSTGADPVLKTLTEGAGISITNGAGSITVAVDGLLEDLDTLGANSADSEFIVGTGAGVLAWESGDTARTSLGLGTGNTPEFAGATLTAFSGLVYATGGVLSAGSLYVPEYGALSILD